MFFVYPTLYLRNHQVDDSWTGAVIGAGLVNFGKSFFTQAFPEYWLYALGLIFILVTLFLPRGVMGFFERKRA